MLEEGPDGVLEVPRVDSAPATSGTTASAPATPPSSAARTIRLVAGALFDTRDLKDAVRSFLEHGPGKATFEGR